MARAAKLNLRAFQQELATRLAAKTAAQVEQSRLGIACADERWLIRLADAGEVIAVPQMATVPLTKPWYLGVANIRGNLYSVTDFSAFARDLPTAMTEHARLLIIAERFRVGAALLVERSLGLRSAEGMKPHASSATQPWVKAQYIDADGTVWKELDVAALVQNESFLEVSL